MKATNVQGTTVRIVTPVPDPKWADCAAANTAILAGVEAMCPQSLGELTRTRAITEYSCISSNESTKSAGKVSYGDFTMELLFDNDDAAGQAALLKAFDDNKPIILALIADDIDTTLGVVGGIGTTIYTEALVSGDGISYPVDGLMGFSVTLAPFNGYIRCPMIAATA